VDIDELLDALADPANLVAVLRHVATRMRQAYPTSPRLEHLDKHVATVIMVVEHIVEEAAREAATTT